MKERELAPLVLFTYNRKKETEECILSLKRANLFEKTDIYIYSDAPKKKEDIEKVEEVRKILKELEKYNNITIVYQSKNKGLANSVIDGVTKLLEKYEKIIVLEDDLVVSKDFIEYMNEALELYKENMNIWSISGYSPRIKIPSKYDLDIFLGKRGSSWGWGTWKNRWNKVDWQVKDFYNLTKKEIKSFNLAGNDMYKMLELQILRKIDSWAIRWCFSQYKENMYTVFPRESKIKNIGFSESATHGGIFIEKYMVELSEKKIKFPKNIEPNEQILELLKKYNDLTFQGKVGYFLKKYNLGYRVIKKIILKIRN